MKVPLIAWGKGIAHGVRSDALTSQYDIFPTLLELTGVPAAERKILCECLPGHSFAAQLCGKADETASVVVYDEYGPARMIREGDYKLVYRYPYGPHELYDLKTDPGEERNRIDEEDLRDVKVRLLQSMEAWFARYASRDVNTAMLPVRGTGQLEMVREFPAGKRVFKEF